MSGNLSITNNLSVGNNISTNNVTTTTLTSNEITTNNLTVNNDVNFNVNDLSVSGDIECSNLNTSDTITSDQTYSRVIKYGLGNVDLEDDLTQMKIDIQTNADNIFNTNVRTTGILYNNSNNADLTNIDNNLQITNGKNLLIGNNVNVQTSLETINTQLTGINYISATDTTNIDNNLNLTASKTISTPNINVSSQMNLTGNIIANGATITPIELAYVDGLNSNIQTQINTKSNINNGNHTGTTTMQSVSCAGLITANGGVTIPATKTINLSGDIVTNTTPNRTITPEEISYLDGVTSSIQVQLNNRANINAPTINNATFTGTTNGITKSMVGLGNCDNTSDVNKPVSTAQQNALNLKANINDATLTGSTNIENLNVTNQFTVNSLGTSNLTYNNTIISNPPVLDGFGIGSGDGLSYSIFNNAIFSWFATGFVDTCNKVCNLLINHRTGSIIMKGELNSATVQTINANATNMTCTTMQATNLQSSTGTISMNAILKSHPFGGVQSLGGYVGCWVLNAGASDSKFDRMYPVIASQKKMGKIDDYWILAGGYRIELYTGLGYTGTKYTYSNTLGNNFVIAKSTSICGNANTIDSVKVFYQETEITLTDF